MNAPDGIRFRSKDKRTLPLNALMNKAVNDYIKAITHICENDALDKCADILELHGWTKQRTCKRLPATSGTVCIVERMGYSMEFGYWMCSECGCECFEGAHYCMNCGAKAVPE